MSLLIAVFACSLVSGGGATHVAIPQSAVAIATVDATAPVVRLAEEDVDDEGESDNDNEGGEKRASLVTSPSGDAGFVRLAEEDEGDDEGDGLEDEGDDVDRS